MYIVSASKKITQMLKTTFMNRICRLNIQSFLTWDKRYVARGISPTYRIYNQLTCNHLAVFLVLCNNPKLI